MALTKIDDRGLKTPIDLLDNEKIRFGTGNDLDLYHTSGVNYIQTHNNSNLEIKHGSDVSIKCIADGSVELYRDGTKRFETTSTGTSITGNCSITGHFYGPDDSELRLGTGDDLKIYHDSNTNVIDASQNHPISFRRGGVEQFFIGNAEFKGGDDKKIKLGTDGDLQIYHNGSHSYIEDTGTGAIKIKGDDVRIEDSAANNIIKSTGSSAELYYDGSKKFETTSTGTKATGTTVVQDFVSDNSGGGYVRFYLGNSGALLGFIGALNQLASGGGTADFVFRAQNSFRFCSGGSTTRLTLDSNGHLTPFASNTYDIGGSGMRFRNGYFQTAYDSKGNLRSIPLVDAPNAHTMAASDAGKAIYLQNNLTIPASTMSEGDAVTIINNSSSDKTITCSAITMYLAGDTTAKTSLTLAGRGMATVWFRNNSNAIISGAGLS